jgi:D-aminoacyl-tRNA deacylase
MRAVIQRASKASVGVDGREVSSIGPGLLVLLSVEDSDAPEDIEWLTGKIANLRIFSDTGGLMNLSVMDIKGEILVVSQFTLHASTKKGNRPSFSRASKPEIAVPMYERFVEVLALKSGLPVRTGVFGAHMQVSLTNDGPVTILFDSKSRE